MKILDEELLSCLSFPYRTFKDGRRYNSAPLWLGGLVLLILLPVVFPIIIVMHYMDKWLFPFKKDSPPMAKYPFVGSTMCVCENPVNEVHCYLEDPLRFFVVCECGQKGPEFRDFGDAIDGWRIYVGDLKSDEEKRLENMTASDIIDDILRDLE